MSWIGHGGTYEDGWGLPESQLLPCGAVLLAVGAVPHLRLLQLLPLGKQVQALRHTHTTAEEGRHLLGKGRGKGRRGVRRGGRGEEGGGT
jgi:hypothetical protein